MNLKKIYNRFFYLNTRARNSWQATTAISSLEAFLVLVICTIFKKIMLSDLKISFPFIFTSFLVICMVIQYFNDKLFKKRNKDFTEQWESESIKNKTIYKICNVSIIIFVFLMSTYILSCLD